MSLMDNVKAAISPAPSPGRPRQRPDDVIELLHGHAAKRFIDLRRKRDEARALAALPSDELNTLRRQRTAAMNRKTGDYGRPRDAATIAAIDVELVEIEANIADVQRIKADRDQKVSSDNQVVLAVENYALDFLLTSSTLLHTIKPAVSRKGENEVDSLYRVRGEISDINADITDTKSRPLPSAEAKAKARDHVSRLIEAGRIDVSGLLRRSGGSVQWPQAYSARQEIEMQAVLANICRELLIARLEKEVDELADDERALTDEQCEIKLKALFAKRLELERDEEHYRCEADIRQNLKGRYVPSETHRSKLQAIR
jgi:hypothetical protein